MWWFLLLAGVLAWYLRRKEDDELWRGIYGGLSVGFFVIAAMLIMQVEGMV